MTCNKHHRENRELPYELLPEGLQGGMTRYIQQGIPPGDFLKAVLSNDLLGAMGRADVRNRERLYDIVGWVYNHAPSSCWGSPERVEKWIAERSMAP